MSSSYPLLPSHIGLPQHFTQFLPNQEEIVYRIFESEKRFICLIAPPGTGKTVIYTSYSLLQGGRSLFLTVTKSLGLQHNKDFSSIGSIDIQGHNNYPCYSSKSLSNISDINCKWNDKCKYNELVKLCNLKKLNSTNISHWLSLYQQRAGNRLGQFDNLIIDEAHEAHNQVSSAVTITLSLHQLRQLRLTLPTNLLNIQSWLSWSRDLLGRIEYGYNNENDTLYQLDSKSNIQQLRFNLLRLQSINQHSDLSNFCIIKDDKQSTISFSPVWGTKYCEEYLFRGINKILLVSATLTEGDKKLLNITPHNAETIEMDSPFALNRRPFIYLSTKPEIRLNFRSSDFDKRKIISRIDQIIKGRLDRKGLIHSRSYEWRDRILDQSKLDNVDNKSNILQSHKPSTLNQELEQFYLSPSPKVFISPSIYQGYDFKNNLARYQILVKMPYLNKNESEIIFRRCKEDKMYEVYYIINYLTQAYGRVVRGTLDWAETFMLDAMWIDFVRLHGVLFQKWFRQAWQIKAEVPRSPGLDFGLSMVERQRLKGQINHES